MNSILQTEYPFTLPRGYVDREGNLHKDGVMRLATAADEILPLKDPRVQSNPAYQLVVLLARVITQLGSLPDVDTRVIEGLFSSDFSYIQDLYNRINGDDAANVEAVCPKCDHHFDVEIGTEGE